MTVENTNPIQHFTANGETTTFVINFTVEGKSNLKVTANGLTISVNEYSYDVLTNSVVFNVAPVLDTEITIERITTLERSINYQTYDNSFRPETLNYDLDRIWHVLQEDHITDAEILARIKDEIEWRRTHDTEWDALAQAREGNLFNALKSYMDTIGAMSVPNLFDGITDNVVITEDGVSQRITNRDIKQSITDLEQALNDAVEETALNVDAERVRATTVESSLTTQITDETARAIGIEQGIQTQLNSLGVGNKAYKTYAAMTADTANIPAKSKVTVTNDSDTTKNGDYQFDGTAFTKSAYDVTTRVQAVEQAFIERIPKNKFNPSLATDGVLISYATGQNVTYATGISFGKHLIEAGKTYTWSLPLDQSFAFQKTIYSYSSNGTFLGMEASKGSQGELVNPNPPINIVYSDSDKTVTFTIPSGSSIAYVAMMIAYRSHTTVEFNNLVNQIQLEQGSARTSFEAYSTNKYLILKETALPNLIPSADSYRDKKTFDVYLDGTYLYIRTGFDTNNDLVQKVLYNQKTKWNNNIVNPSQIKTIPKSTARTNLISAYNSGVLIVTQGDDAAPLYYNNTYIGGNHGAYVVHQISANAHGKTYTDVGSKWSNGSVNFTLIRVLDSNTLWFISDNLGTTEKWAYSITSLTGNTLTHVNYATQTTNINVSADLLTQLTCAINNHSIKVIANKYDQIQDIGFYEVDSIEVIDSYDVMNVPAIVSYLQSRVGTATEQEINHDSIKSDMRVSVNYHYVVNGSSTINTQIQAKSAVNFSFTGFTQASPLVFTGKTLHQYVPKVQPITGTSKTWNFANIEDITTTIDSINFLKTSWIDPSNPPDRMAQIVKNGVNKEFGHVIGYALSRGITRPTLRQNTDNAGFVYTSRKMYPKAVTANTYANGTMPVGTVINAVAYRSIYNPSILPEATIYTWYKDNDAVYVVFDIHQNASMLKLPLPSEFNGKDAVIVDSNSDFILHSEIVNDGGLLVSVANGYGQATIKIS